MACLAPKLAYFWVFQMAIVAILDKIIPNLKNSHFIGFVTHKIVEFDILVLGTEICIVYVTLHDVTCTRR